MYKPLLTNPVTGKVINSSNIKLISIIVNDFFPKINKPKKVIRKPKNIIQNNITDDEYFFLNRN